jgi:hypothetical protein
LLVTSDGSRLLVSGVWRHADLSCCQLRSALVAPRRTGHPHLLDVVVEASLVGGAIDLGGGLFQPSHPSGADERWFVTTLPSPTVVEIAERCPLPLPDDAMSVVLKPDVELGSTVVVMSARLGFGFRLDEAAFWLLSACAAEELIRSTARG